MRKTMKFAAAMLLAALIGGSGAAGLFAGQATAASSQGEAAKAAGADPALQTAPEKQETEKALQATQREKAVQEEMQKRAAEAELNAPVVKTYSLKYIGASEFMRSAKFYVYDSTGTESSLTVKIAKRNIPDFEALLKKLDVEKKNIQFQVYAIVASKDDPPDSYKNYAQTGTKEIADKDLKRVLDEMKGLWNFKHYWIDSPSFLIAKDGSGSNRSKLVSRHDLEMILRNIQLRGDEPGKRIISVGEIALTQNLNSSVDNLINTSDITLKEKGYLVVGVSGLRAGWNGLALILVISAEIK
jgi:hypothetical protein